MQCGPENNAGSARETDPEKSSFLDNIQQQPISQSMTMALLFRQQAFRGALPRELLAACTISLDSRHFSVLNRPPSKYPGHVPLTRIEKAGLAVGSAVMSLMDPHRGGMASFD